MPCSPRKARVLLKEGKAKVVNRTPFTIQLLYATGETKQNIILGVDAGSKTIGLSATTPKKELYSAEVAIRNDVVELLATRKQNRKNRRSRLRYRKHIFLNRVKNKKKGWLAPSILNKIDAHLRVINMVYKILPVTNIIVEVASFDIQKINNPDISGKEYQQGEQLGFWNVREYVLFRDGHKCHGKNGCKNKILNVHHIETRKTGGDAPSNLITLCKECHKDYHNGKLKLNLKRGVSFKDAAFMGIMRKNFCKEIIKLYPNTKLTYGYITKNTRITNGLEKSHRVDARCISGNPIAISSDNWYHIKQKRRHNRQIHRANLLKGGIKKNNQAPYEVKGFRLFDKVLFENIECFISGRRSTGLFKIKLLDGTLIKESIKFSKLKLLQRARGLLIEERANKQRC
jgi:N6-L-threonylcarbamoyladenine synthase